MIPMTTRRSLVFAAALTLVASASAGAQQRDLLDRAVTAWTKVRTARATFEQTIVNALTGNTLTATDRIVADGKHVWLYLPSSAPGQVIRTTQGAGGTGTVDLSAQFLTAPRSRYNVTAAGSQVVSGRSTHAFTLVPKTASGAPFKTATVYIDDADATIRQFAVTEQNGVQRTVRLTSFRTNVPVDASAFRFTPPSGTRIVER